MKITLEMTVFLGILFLAMNSTAGQSDKVGCKDHSLFPSRMPDYELENCKVEDFGAYEFGNPENLKQYKKTRIEGKFTFLTYAFKGPRGSEPSGLAVVHNYETAIKKVNGTIEMTDENRTITGKIIKDNKEAWAEVYKGNGKILLRIVEKKGMEQHIVADAAAFNNDIRATGHAAVYGIYFDTGKADIKSESKQAIGEIANLLKSDPELKIVVVGHTDNKGSVESNLKLSQDRAQAVMQSLIRDQNIVSSRLRAYGCGQFAPVASNDAEDGRAKNRRVELVKQ